MPHYSNIGLGKLAKMSSMPIMQPEDDLDVFADTASAANLPSTSQADAKATSGETLCQVWCTSTANLRTKLHQPSRSQVCGEDEEPPTRRRSQVCGEDQVTKAQHFARRTASPGTC
jgi:hypothetical protein